MKSNSIITKNHFNTFSFLSCLLSLPLLFSTSSKWNPAMVFTTSSYSQYIFPSRIQSSPITDGLGLLFAMLPPLLHPSDSLTALCQCLSHKGLVNAVAGFLLLSLSGFLRKQYHWQFRFISSVLLFSYSVQSVLLGVIFLMRFSLLLEWGKVLQLFFCFRKKDLYCLGFTQKILCSFLKFSRGASMVQTGRALVLPWPKMS